MPPAPSYSGDHQLPTIHRTLAPSAAHLSGLEPPTSNLGEPGSVPTSGPAFEAVVDAVVERIERRVMEELERRGRWPGWELY